MIKRIVRMSFHEEKVPQFLDIFNQSKEKIANFEGCLALNLYQDVTQKNVFYTVSWWENEKSLENYRNSDLFYTTWQKTKVLFNDKPLAFSLQIFDEVKKFSDTSFNPL